MYRRKHIPNIWTWIWTHERIEFHILEPYAFVWNIFSPIYQTLYLLFGQFITQMIIRLHILFKIFQVFQHVVIHPLFPLHALCHADIFRPLDEDPVPFPVWRGDRWIHFFYSQLDFSSEPGVANKITENESKKCLTVALFYIWFYMF